jgi:hypothetical protein
MNVSLTYLLNNADEVSKVDESFILQKIKAEPFVQGWKLILAKLKEQKVSNFGFYQSNVFYANDYLRTEKYDESEIITLEDKPSSQNLASREQHFEIIEEAIESIDVFQIDEQSMNEILDLKNEAEDIVDLQEDNEEKSNNLAVEKENFDHNMIKPDKKKRKKKKEKKKAKNASALIAMDMPAYVQWLLSLEPLLEAEHVKKKSGKKKKKNKEHKLAKSSVTKKKLVISEPLAELLLAQGHVNESIEMYKQLSLVFPEKNTYFAAKISEINNLK